MSRIVIPGGSGQVGHMLARAFREAGHDVVVLSREPTGTLPPGALDFGKLIPKTLPRSVVFQQEDWCLWDLCVIRTEDGAHHLLWETISGPPRGDNTLAGAKAALGDRICHLGNLDQVDFLKRATAGSGCCHARHRPHRQARRPLHLLHLRLPRKLTPRENVVAMNEAAKEEGRY